MSVYISVGRTVVGAFDSPRSAAALACLKALAPGIKPQIKKTPPNNYEWRGKYRSNELRQATNRKGKTKLLKPGEFSL